MKVSKELLSGVLGLDIVDYSIVENTVRINLLYHPDTALNRELELANTSYGSKGSINIYELAHKCKEWALKNEHNLLSYLSDRNGLQESFVQLYNYKTFITTIRADTEPEAIFEACQWILDNKEI